MSGEVEPLFPENDLIQTIKVFVKDGLRQLKVMVNGRKEPLLIPPPSTSNGKTGTVLVRIEGNLYKKLSSAHEWMSFKDNSEPETKLVVSILNQLLPDTSPADVIKSDFVEKFLQVIKPQETN